MSATTTPRHSFPLPPLLGVMALLTLALAAATVGRLTGAATPQPTGSVLVSRDLRFQDQQNGGLAAYDADNGALVYVVPAGTNGFLRATLRGLASERKLEQRGPRAPFRLTAWNDGRLTLVDTATGRSIDLEAFGITNETAFARLLPRVPASSRHGGS